MKYSLFTGCAVIFALCLAPTAALAGEPEDRIIGKVVAAYGGDDLTGLQSITISEDVRTSWIGQGYTPDYVELPQMKTIIQVDFNEEQGSIENWLPSNASHTRAFNTDAGLTTINYGPRAYEVNPEGTFYGQFGGSIRTSDVLLARELYKEADTAEYQGTQAYLNKPHDVLTFEMPQSPPLTLYINADTGLITKMQRVTGSNTLVYQFGNYTQTDGITYGQDFDLWVDGVMVEYAKSVTVEANNVRDRAFKLDRGLTASGERVDTSEMTVDGIGDLIHHVGMDGAYSSFIDIGDYLIGVGGSAGFKDRWDAYASDHADNTKPLRYMIATHHHEDHLQGLAEAHEMGVTFITPEMAVKGLKAVTGPTLTDDKIKVIDGQMTKGPVEIHDIKTKHVGSFALVYVPESKTLIQVDHYGGQFVDGPSPANRNTLTLKDEIDRLGLDVEGVVSLHVRKVESWDNFEKAVADFNPDPCSKSRPICR